MKQSLRDTLLRAHIEPSYAFHESVEDALAGLPMKRRRVRPPYGRARVSAVAICAALVICALPFAYRWLQTPASGPQRQLAQPDSVQSGEGSGTGQDGGKIVAITLTESAALRQTEEMKVSIEFNAAPMSEVIGEPDPSQSIEFLVPAPDEALIEAGTAAAVEEAALSDYRLIIDDFSLDADMATVTVRLIGKGLSDQELRSVVLSELMIDGRRAGTELFPVEYKAVQGGCTMRFTCPYLSGGWEANVLCAFTGMNGRLSEERVFRYDGDQDPVTVLDGEEARSLITSIREGMETPVSYRMLGFPDTQNGFSMMLDTVDVYSGGFSVKLMCNTPAPYSPLQLSRVSIRVNGEDVCSGRPFVVTGKGGPDWPLGAYEGKGALVSQLFELPRVDHWLQEGDQLELSCVVSERSENEKTVSISVSEFSVGARIDPQYIASPPEHWLEDAQFFSDENNAFNTLPVTPYDDNEFFILPEIPPGVAEFNPLETEDTAEPEEPASAFDEEW